MLSVSSGGDEGTTKYNAELHNFDGDLFLYENEVCMFCMVYLQQYRCIILYIIQTI